MALIIPCPNCGDRPYTEYWCSGEIRPPMPASAGSADADDFARVWMRDNVAGLCHERWFHFAGCRRWVSVRRDTRTNVVHDARRIAMA